jgi:hypothetical protein
MAFIIKYNTMNITIQPSTHHTVENATIVSNQSDNAILFQKAADVNPNPAGMHTMLPRVVMTITAGESVVFYNPNTQAINIVVTL